MASEAPHRLHALSLLFRIGSTVRSLFVPALLAVFASAKTDNFVWVLAFVVPSVLHAVVHYLTYRYGFEDGELVARGGLLFRFERHIPYERIQNIDLYQNPFHRLFGVADVKIETASGAEAEAHMQVLTLDAVRVMREHVFTGRPGRAGVGSPDAQDESAGSGDVPAEVVRMRAGDLILFGIISNRGLAVVLGALAVVWELDLFDLENIEIEEEQAREVLTRTVSEQLGLVASTVLVEVLVLVLAVFVLLRLLSIGWAFVQLHGFTLRREGDDLQTRCGLWGHHTATIPRRRIQCVTLSAGWLHRLFGRVAVKVDTAGGSTLEQSAATRRWIAPLVRRRDLPPLLAEIHPHLDPTGVDWQPVHPTARRRLLKRWILVVLASGLGAAATWSRWGAWGLALPSLLLVWGVVDAPLRARRLGWALDEQAFWSRRGLWTRTVRAVPLTKLQALALCESPFDRRWGTASLRVDTAGTLQGVDVPFLPVEPARGLSTRLADLAATTTFRW